MKVLSLKDDTGAGGMWVLCRACLETIYFFRQRFEFFSFTELGWFLEPLLLFPFKIMETKRPPLIRLTLNLIIIFIMIKKQETFAFNKEGGES